MATSRAQFNCPSPAALTSLLLLLLSAATGVSLNAQFNCPECAPPRKPGYSVAGNKKVCVDTVFTAEDENKIKAGATWWNERMSTRSSGVYFDFAAPGDQSNCNIIIGLDYGLNGSSQVAYAQSFPNGDGLINFNPQKIATETFNYISYASGHEFYHMLGWSDYPEGSPQPSTCDGMSLMAGVFPGHPGLPGDMGCGDRVTVAASYPPLSGVDCATDPGHPDCSPLIIDTSGNGFVFTWARNGVLFDLDADGHAELVGWTRRNTDDAWLAIDRNGNGTIDNGAELFGNVTRGCQGETAANGFEALKMFEDDCIGPSVKDGIIDANDAIFQRLLLWRDFNKDGKSTPDELTAVSASPLRAINTNYATVSRERRGNEIRQVSSVTWGNGRRCIVDVWLDAIEPE